MTKLNTSTPVGVVLICLDDHWEIGYCIKARKERWLTQHGKPIKDAVHGWVPLPPLPEPEPDHEMGDDVHDE